MGGRPGAGARLRELAILTGAMAVISAAVFFFLVPSPWPRAAARGTLLCSKKRRRR